MFSACFFGQNCTCEANFEWVKKTFEENDAGFQYALDAKGKEAYEKHNKLIEQKVKSLTKPEQCTQLLYEWLQFFRAGHIAIVKKEQGGSQNSAAVNNEKWETRQVKLREFESYLASKKEADFEGLWYTDPYTIGIKKEGMIMSGLS